MAEEKEFGAFYLCMAKGCGDVAGRTPKNYCNLHKTAEERKQLTIDNDKIQAEWNERKINIKDNER